MKKNLPDGSAPDDSQLTKSGSMTITARNAVQDITIDGTKVVAGGTMQAGAEISTDEGSLAVTTFYSATRVLEYTYTLKQSTTEHKDPGQNDSVTHTLRVEAFDADGEIGSADLMITVLDDKPSIRVDKGILGNVPYGTTVNGKFSIKYGADGEADTDRIIVNGVTPVTNGGDLIFNLTEGTLTIKENGDYTFEVKSYLGFELNVTIKDCDDDTATATIVTASRLCRNDDGNYTVIGNLTLPEGQSLTIENGKYMEIPAGASLTNNGEIKGDGQLLVFGGINGTGTVSVKNQLTKDGEENYTVKGNITLPTDKTLTVETGKTLTVDPDNTLTVEGSLKNNGTIENCGTLNITESGSLTNTGTVVTETGTLNTVGNKPLGGTVKLTVVFRVVNGVFEDGSTQQEKFMTLTDGKGNLKDATILSSTPFDGYEGGGWSPHDPTGEGAITTVNREFTYIYAQKNGNTTLTDANAWQKAAVQETLATGEKEVKLNYTEGNKIVDKEIFRSIAGKDITVTFNMGTVQWLVSGLDIPADMDFKDLNLGVIVDRDEMKNLIPVEVTDPLTGEVKTIQCELLHNGPFGFRMYLHISLGQEYAGMTALLRYYNETTGTLEDVAEGAINGDGIVLLPMDHASKYVISIGTAGMSKQNTPAPAAPVEAAPKSPKTGENNFGVYYLVLVAVAGIGLAVAGKKKKEIR